jgi:hypothetical protein
VNPYLDKGLNEFQRLILFSQFLTIFGGIMFKLVESVDKLLESEETPSKRQERDIIAALIVAVNLIAIGIYPIYRMIAVASGFKGGVFLSQLYFSLTDTVQILMGGRVKESHSNVKFQGKSKNLLNEARQHLKEKNLLKEAWVRWTSTRRSPAISRRSPPEPISQSNHLGAPALCPALLDFDTPVYISTEMPAARAPPESLSAAAATGAKYSDPTPPSRYSQISADIVTDFRRYYKV